MIRKINENEKFETTGKNEEMRGKDTDITYANASESEGQEGQSAAETMRVKWQQYV